MSIRPAALSVFTLLLAGFGQSALADTSIIRGSLTGTAPAQGVVRCTLSDTKSSLRVSVAGLAPFTEYTFYVGDTPEAKFTTDSRGSKALAFALPASPRFLLLDFDPRGRELSVRSFSGTEVLSGLFDAPGSANSAGAEKVSLDASAEAASVKAAYKTATTGRRTFVVSASRLPAGHSLYVDGIKRGEFVAGRRRLAFDTAPKSTAVNLLDFDPRDKGIDVVNDGDGSIAASGEMRAKIADVNEAEPSKTVGFIPSTVLAPDGTARTKSKVDERARRKFEVELEDVPVGTYELLVGPDVPVKVADIVVTPSTEGGTEGEVEFVNYEDNDEDHLPLTFDPVNAHFTVMKGGGVYFQGLSVAVGGGEGDGASIEEYLTPTASAPAGAKAEAKFEEDDDGDQKFEVELEDVAVGTYTLWVGSVQRGEIEVEVSDESPEGEIEFEDGELDFDPRDQLVEIKNIGGTVLFSHTFGSGSAATPPGAGEVEATFPLISTGVLAAPARAKMEFKRDEDGAQSFEVELEDAPAGSYVLFVGGTDKGVIPSDLEGDYEIEFEDGTLDFDPRGQLISIRRQSDSAVCFERLLPADL